MNRKDQTLDVLSNITAANGKDKNNLTEIAVTAVDRTGNESDFVVYPILEQTK